MKGAAYMAAALADGIASCFSAKGYRVIPGNVVVHKPGFKRIRPGSGAARCNPEGIERLYFALDVRTAHAEYDYHMRQNGLDPDASDKFVFPVEIKLGLVVNVTDGAVRRKLGLTLADIASSYAEDTGQPLGPMQELGVLVNSGAGNASGIIFPSQRRKAGRNIVVFTNRLATGVDSLISSQDTSDKLP